jgi:hypothetical protein
MLLSQGPDLRHLHHSLLLQVDLVADDAHGHSGRAVVLDLLDPAVQRNEAVSVRDVEDEDDCVRVSVVERGDGLELFLPGSVPNLG